MTISSFDEDQLELLGFAERLEKYIETKHDYVDGSLVVALASRYGSGKTTFFQMWRNRLENPVFANTPSLVVLLNAWESDYYGDPLFAIISALVESLQIRGETATGLLEAAKDIGWFTTAISSQIVDRLIGIDPISAGQVAADKRAIRNGSAELMPSTFTAYQHRKTAMDALKESISALICDTKPKVLFLVDELDRCRPDYAISYLETIKHIFDIKGAVFVLAADRHQLENSARTAFGSELDFEEYYRKFVSREVCLPEISKSGYRKLTMIYVKRYLELDENRFCFMKLDPFRVDDIAEILGFLRLTPRQIQEVFRTLGHIFNTTKEKQGKLREGIAIASIAMISFKIGAPRIFNLLGTSRLDPQEALDFLRNFSKTDSTKWWFKVLLAGEGLRREEGDSDEDLLVRVGLIEKSSNSDIDMEIRRYRVEFGGYSSRMFHETYERIMQLSQWDL